MARFVFGMQQSLDGYVDHQRMAPGRSLFRHFIEHIRDVAGMLYGRRLYEIMSYWDQDMDDWGAEEREYAAVWRSKHKWVVSRSLNSVGPNATLVTDHIEATLRKLKADLAGEVDVAGPVLAHSLSELGLIDEYRLYMQPFVLGHGTPFFAGPRPPLRLLASEMIVEGVVRLSYVPA
jgi:dihydrofolate reductase